MRSMAEFFELHLPVSALYSPSTASRFPDALAIRDLLTVDEERAKDVGASRGLQVVVVGGFLDTAFYDIQGVRGLRIAVQGVHRLSDRSRFLEILHKDGHSQQRGAINGHHPKG